MLWKVLLSLGALSGYQASVIKKYWTPPSDFQPSKYGPQTPEEAALAHMALYGNHFGDDMRFSDSFNTSDAGLRDTNYRWPGYPGGAVVPYVIDNSLKIYKDLVQLGMEFYHKHTCIRFVPKTNEQNYINIYSGQGCWSMVGRIGNGRQDLSLGNGCLHLGVIIHELGHAIGLKHEHQRSDRDTHINVYLNNVVEGQQHNFVKYSASIEMVFTEYDYNSIMHYGNYAFSKSNTQKTMEAKNGQRLAEPYEKIGFTPSDIETIQRLYKCK